MWTERRRLSFDYLLPHFHNKTVQNEKLELVLYGLFMLVANYELLCFSLLGTFHDPGISIWLINGNFPGPIFPHLKKSGQHLSVSAPQAFLFTKISPRPLTGSRVWISTLLDDDSEVLQWSFYIQPQGLFYSCTQCWVSVLCWAIASDIFSLRTMSFMEKDGAQKESWEVLLLVITSHIVSSAPSSGLFFFFLSLP